MSTSSRQAVPAYLDSEPLQLSIGLLCPIIGHRQPTRFCFDNLFDLDSHNIVLPLYLHSPPRDCLTYFNKPTPNKADRAIGSVIQVSITDIVTQLA